MAWSSLTAIFRRLFSRRSTNSTSDPALPVEIGAGEDFVRFILSRSQFAPGPGRVKPQALMPMFNAAKRRFETSTHRIAGLPDAQLWELGYSCVENPAEKRVVKASGIGKFELVTGQGLALDVNGEPYPRHVDIVNWPDDKNVRLMRATEIADKLRLLVDPR